MEFKGTKGTWFVDGEHITTGYDNISETICDINPNTEYPCVHERSVVESKYNAKLISHAPEMLEKLSLCKVMFSKGKRLTTTDMAIMVDEIKYLLTRATTI